MKIHHIGYLVSNIKNASLEFERLGFSQIGDIVEDLYREIYILFLDNGGYIIELVQPMNMASQVISLMRKYCNTPYHICYETDDLQREIENIVKTKGNVLMQEPKPATVISGCPDVAFIMSRNVGMIELIQFR